MKSYGQLILRQALKQEREVMRENRKTMEDKVAELTENYAASKMNWDKEVKQRLRFSGGDVKTFNVKIFSEQELFNLVFSLFL